MFFLSGRVRGPPYSQSGVPEKYGDSFMKVVILGLAALAAAPALAAPVFSVPTAADPTVERVVAGVSAARIKSNIRKLASFGTRNSLSETESDTRGIGAARRWIKGELERCAAESGGRLQVAFDDHLVESGPRVPRPTHIVNVVATLP